MVRIWGAVALVSLWWALACTSGSGSVETCSSGTLTDATVDAFCQKVAALSCPLPNTQCVSALQAFRAQYVEGCCGSAAAELVQCGASNGLRCAELDNDVLFPPACSAVEEKFDQCSGSHDNCTEHIQAGEWRVECDQYAADCQNAGDVRNCICTYGPHQGKKFEVSTTLDEVVPSVAAACK